MIPVHPIIDHFTIALFTISVIFEIVGRMLKRDGLIYAAYWSLAFATFSVIVSYVSGMLAEQGTYIYPIAKDIAELHEMLGLVTLIFIVGLFLWRLFIRDNLANKLRWLYITVSVIALAALFVTSYYGTLLVYEHGAGVKPVIDMMTG